MHNGLIASLSLYLIKYLNEFFVPYDSSLETNISLTSMSIGYFFVFIKVTFFYFLSPKFMFFLLILILGEKKVFFLTIWVSAE